MKYKRILLKLSGEALMGDKNHGIDSIKLDSYAKEIKKIYNHGIQIAIVIGGGNIFRGVSGASKGRKNWFVWRGWCWKNSYYNGINK